MRILGVQPLLWPTGSFPTWFPWGPDTNTIPLLWQIQFTNSQNTSSGDQHCQRHNGPEGWVLLIKVSSKSQTNINISTKLNFKILTKPSFGILTKIKPHYLNQASVAKYWPSFSFKIFKFLTKPCAQSLNKKLTYCQTSASKSAPNCRQHGFQHQHQQQKKPTSFDLASPHARVT